MIWVTTARESSDPATDARGDDGGLADRGRGGGDTLELPTRARPREPVHGCGTSPPSDGRKDCQDDGVFSAAGTPDWCAPAQPPYLYTGIMGPRGILPTLKRSLLFWSAYLLIAGCSSERAQQKLEPTERALQPTVSAIECGGDSVKDAIASCRVEGAQYGRCAIVAWHAGVSDATACYTYASKIHRRRERLVGQEDQLDAQIHYLQDVNVDTQGLDAELAIRVDEVTARTDSAVESLARGEMTESELAQLRAILDNEVSSAERQLDTAFAELQGAERYRAQQQPSTAALDAQIARLQALLNEARRRTHDLVAQRQRI